MRTSPPLEEYWERISSALPEFSADERRIAVALYRALARGNPLGIGELAVALDLSKPAAEDMLQRPSIRCLAFRDQQGRVAGFGGLATKPMHHQFAIRGRRLSTWCAWDSLFIPAILGEPARVRSTDPESGEEVSLRVTPRRVSSIHPGTTVVSFPTPDDAAFSDTATTALRSFCHFVFFFSTPDSGRAWTRRHPGTFLYSIEEAFELGNRLVRQRFGTEPREP